MRYVLCISDLHVRSKEQDFQPDDPRRFRALCRVVSTHSLSVEHHQLTVVTESCSTGQLGVACPVVVGTYGTKPPAFGLVR